MFASLLQYFFFDMTVMTVMCSPVEERAWVQG